MILTKLRYTGVRISICKCSLQRHPFRDIFPRNLVRTALNFYPMARSNSQKAWARPEPWLDLRRQHLGKKIFCYQRKSKSGVFSGGTE